MAEPQVQEFVDALEEKLGIGLSESQKEQILESPDIRWAQRLAQALDVPELIINNVSRDMELPGLGPTIGALPEGAELIEPERVSTNELGQTIVINPDGSATVVGGTGLSPAEEEQAATIEALLNIVEGDVDDDTKNYLLLGDAEYQRTKDIIASPGYRYTYGEGFTAPAIANPVIYEAGDEVEKWSNYSPAMRAAFTKAMIEAEMLDAEDFGSYAGDEPSRFSPARRVDGVVQRANQWEGVGALDPSGASRLQVDAFREALATAGYLGTTPMAAIFARGETTKANPATGPSGGGRAAFSVPAQFRTIPDYETLQQRVTELMRGAMGREAEDWEVALLADEMQTQHKSFNEKMIEASRAAYERGNRGVGQEIEVPDPVVRTRKFFEETYENELTRRQDIGQAANSNNLMMDALTQGGGMVS